MKTYFRNSIAEFKQPIDKASIEALIEYTKGHHPLWGSGSMSNGFCYYALLHFAIPKEVAKESIRDDMRHDPQLITDHIANWQKTITEDELMQNICEAMVSRTEHVDSDEIWTKGFGNELARVFGVPKELGIKSMETPAEPGTAWCRVVAANATSRIKNFTLSGEF